MPEAGQRPVAAWRERTRRVIFEADTAGGKAFDVALLLVIAVSVLLVMLESIPDVRDDHGEVLIAAEWVVTVLFTIEYVLRLATVERPRRYARSFFGVIDLLAILPGYLAVLFPGAQSLVVIRSLRLLRVFRVFKMAQWLREANYLLEAVRASGRKIVVFLATVLLINVIVGSSMYVIEGPASGFENMFIGVYWSIVTMSTVGFGDIAPVTPFGRTVASGLMILGYSVIAVPTGIVSSEVASAERRRGAVLTAEAEGGRGPGPTTSCPGCGATGHQPDAAHCRRCGTPL